jgi:hypothetical protein
MPRWRTACALACAYQRGQCQSSRLSRRAYTAALLNKLYCDSAVTMPLINRKVRAPAKTSHQTFGDRTTTWTSLLPPRLKTANAKPITYLAPSLTSVSIWIDPGTNWYGPRSGKRGRSQTFNQVAIEFCLTIAWILDAPLRRAIEAVRSVLRAASLDWRVPDYSTLSRRNKEVLSLPTRVIRRQPPLHLLLDNAGVSIVLNSNATGPGVSTAHHDHSRKLILTMK